MDFTISTITASDKGIPEVPCDFGEKTLSDVIQMEPLYHDLLKPVVLTFSHSVVELPEHSAIVIKSYDDSSKEWNILDSNAGK